MKIKTLSFDGQNRKILKIRDRHFGDRLILRRLAFFDCVLLQNCTYILASFKHLPFLPKMGKYDVTKTPFSKKKYWTEFSEILFEDVKFMLEK